MTAFDIINLCMNLCAFLITTVLLIGVILGGNLKQPVFRWFFILILSSLLGMFSEGAIALFYDVPGTASRVICRILDFISYACAGLWFFAFAVYLYEYLSLKTKLTKKLYYLMTFFGAAAIIFAIIAQFNGMYGVFDEQNNYQQQELFWVSQLFPTISFLTCIIVTLRYIKKLRPREWGSLLLYPFTPVACYAIEIAYPALWVAHAGSAFTMLLMYVTLYVELRQQNMKQELELQEARVTVMLSQIQPHFLYNSLGSIQDLCRRDTVEAEQTIRDFARYLRHNLDSISLKEPIPFAQELEHVKLYLSLEKKRFGERLNVVFDIAVETDKFYLPALVLQALVENAVTHGITERVEGGTLTIRARTEAAYFCVSVEDDGVGFPDTLPHEANRTHIGIENTRYRLALCGGELAIQSTPGVGTAAVISIPTKGGI